MKHKNLSINFPSKYYILSICKIVNIYLRVPLFYFLIYIFWENFINTIITSCESYFRKQFIHLNKIYSNIHDDTTGLR